MKKTLLTTLAACALTQLGANAEKITPVEERCMQVTSSEIMEGETLMLSQLYKVTIEPLSGKGYQYTYGTIEDMEIGTILTHTVYVNEKDEVLHRGSQVITGSIYGEIPKECLPDKAYF